MATGSDLDPISFGRLYQIETIRLWDAASGTLVHTFGGPTTPVHALAFSPDGGRLLSGSNDNLVRLWDVSSGKLIRTFDGHSGAITTVSFSADGTRAVSGSADGTLRIWSVDTGELLTTLLSEEKKWLAIMPDGFFATSSPADAQSLSIVRGVNVYDVSQMFQALYAPDLVREKLSGDPDGEVKSATRALNLETVIDSGAPPSVELLSPVAGNASSDEVITAEAAVTAQAGGIGRIEWRVNGVTIAVGTAPGTEKERTVRQTLALEPGRNVIELARHNGVNSLSLAAGEHDRNLDSARQQPRPKLHVISVGINSYHDKLFGPLRQAVADAKALGVAMKAAGEGLYSEVDVTYVLDADATAEGLGKAIDAVGARMHPRDAFIFLAAAHGKSENGRFHLIPQDYRSDAPGSIAEKAIGQEKLQDWFANRIKARRGLILLDTCESGAVVASRASGLDMASSDAALGRLNEAIGPPGSDGGCGRSGCVGRLSRPRRIHLRHPRCIEEWRHQQQWSDRVERACGAHSDAGAASEPGVGWREKSGGGKESPRSAGKHLANALLAPRLADRGLWRQQDYPATGYSQKPRLGSRGGTLPAGEPLTGAAGRVRRVRKIPILELVARMSAA